MSTITRSDFADTTGRRAPRKVEIEGHGEAYLRSPTFGEWYPLIVEHQKHEGRPCPPQLVAETIAVMLCDSEGGRLVTTGDEASILTKDPRFVMALFQVCRDAMVIRDEEVEEARGK